ncbi:MAG: hypothetical protein K9G64_08295 [Bacteroidia bacterium]|nr:hypothetical protein [Bacteroidia bacterium]
MKTKALFAIAILSIIFACGTSNSNIKGEFDTFKVFTDSLLGANNEYLKGSDTTYIESPSAEDPSLVVLDSFVVAHSNLFDTSQYNYTININPTLEKYNAMEQHFDSAKAKMDAKTLALFETIKQKMNEIKQPIK